MLLLFVFFFFNDTATTEIYTLSLHDALPISWRACKAMRAMSSCRPTSATARPWPDCWPSTGRSEEHTSELQSHLNLVCRLLLEKKKNKASLFPNSTLHLPPHPLALPPSPPHP